MDRRAKYQVRTFPKYLLDLKSEITALITKRTGETSQVVIPIARLSIERMCCPHASFLVQPPPVHETSFSSATIRQSYFAICLLIIGKILT